MNTAEFCPKTSVLAVLDPTTGRFPNNLGPDAIVRTHVGQSVQAAIDAATDVNSDGYVIVGVVANDGASGGHATESIVIDRIYRIPSR